MDIEGFIRMSAQLADNGRPKGQVRDEMPVHHINMDHIRTGIVDTPNFGAELGEIC
jgi:hypothetical protein